MRGFINETHMDAAEAMFPGIRRFYDELGSKPTTFLELLWEYQQRGERCEGRTAPRSPRRVRRQGR
jgi:hypothetical protein